MDMWTLLTKNSKRVDDLKQLFDNNVVQVVSLLKKKLDQIKKFI